MRTFEQTLEWYSAHQTTQQIGFNPNGMCLKVCRTARGIPAKYASAKAAQDATPASHQVREVRDLRRGMVLYYDDPSDSNKFGHIVTMIGRVKGYDPDDLSDVLVETNSVKSGELVVVRGDYFPRFWRDPFVFGATWLNGFVLDVPNPAPPAPDKKPIRQIAKEVIAGRWGNGPDRKRNLKAAGYDPAAVQAEVNRLLS